MKRAVIVLLLLLAWPAAARANFPELVRTMERMTGARKTYIPFLSIARSFIRMVEPQGVSDLRIAVFDGHRDYVKAGFDEAIRASLGPGWQPIVTATNRRNAERALIFGKPTKRGMRMLIVAAERGEGVIVELELDPRKFSHFINDARYGRVTFHW